MSNIFLVHVAHVKVRIWVRKKTMNEFQMGCITYMLFYSYCRLKSLVICQMLMNSFKELQRPDEKSMLINQIHVCWRYVCNTLFFKNVVILCCWSPVIVLPLFSHIGILFLFQWNGRKIHSKSKEAHRPNRKRSKTKARTSNRTSTGMICYA